MDDEVLLQYQRELANLRPIAEEIQKVLHACRGKVGKTISQKEFEALLEESRRRGRQRAGMATEEYGPPKAPTLSELK
jgi:hypothetical protein